MVASSSRNVVNILVAGNQQLLTKADQTHEHPQDLLANLPKSAKILHNSNSMLNSSKTFSLLHRNSTILFHPKLDALPRMKQTGKSVPTLGMCHNPLGLPCPFVLKNHFDFPRELAATGILSSGSGYCRNIFGGTPSLSRRNFFPSRAATWSIVSCK